MTKPTPSRSKSRSNRPPRRRRTLRLSDSVAPTAIGLHFDLDPRRKSFRGEACYSVEIKKKTSQIELHSAELDVRRVRAWAGSNALPHEGRDETKGWVEEHPECETILLKFDRPLAPGVVQIELDFRGTVRSDLRGLYRSTDRKQPWLATQLCPTDARRFFPCFDEPGIKARYSISVTAPSDLTILSNGKIERENPAPRGRKRVDFETTPPLSAYLIAVALGPFEATRAKRCGNTEIRVYTLPGRKPLAKFAHRAAVESLVRLEKWFAMPHPYSKLDLVALPDFAFGAMENAGAVFFRDSVLLLDEAEASVEDQMQTAETVAHELSHMWFGNWVTMAWWNDLWLNESFATWMAYEIIDDWRPEWQIWRAFIRRREQALLDDALASSHPIAPPIRTAEEAHENFDAITYTKGASVLRMLERFLGARTFKSGVRRYVRSHGEGAATAQDLWRALSDVASLDVEKIVSPWTLNTGYPIVRVKKNASNISLTQHRFLALNPPKRRASKSSLKASRNGVERWSIPWVGRAGKGARSREIKSLLERKRGEIALEKSDARWVYGNGSESGFFRIDHGNAGFKNLLEAAPSLSALERLGFVGHQWALVTEGSAPVRTMLDLIGALQGELDPDVLFAVESVLGNLLRTAAGTEPLSQAVQKWIAAQFESQVQDDELLGKGMDRNLREIDARRRRARLVAIVGGLAGTPEMGEACHARVVKHLEKGTPLPKGAADEVVRIAASAGGEKLYGDMLVASRKAETPQIRRRFLFALAAFGEPALLDQTLAAVHNRRVAPAIDRAALLITLLGSARSAPAAWGSMQENWSSLEREMPPILLARVVSATARGLPPTRAAETEVKQFFAEHPLAAGQRVLRQVREEFALTRQTKRHAAADLATYFDR